MNEIQILAQTTVPGTPPGPATRPQVDAPWWVTSPLPLIVIMLVILMIMSTRAKKGQENKRVAMLKQLKKGDEVQMIGGEFGRVVDVDTTKDRVLVKVDETSNAKIWYSRASIHKVVTEEDAKATAK